MDTPSGMLPVEKFAQAKGLAVEEAIEKIRTGTYQGRIIGGEWFVYDDQLSKTGGSSSNPQKIKSDSNYSLARTLQKIFVFIGWLVILIGGISALVGVDSAYSNKLAAALPGLGICFTGILIVAAAQITLAVIDTADNSRHILEELRNRRS